jgi:hypothetical protein
MPGKKMAPVKFLAVHGGYGQRNKSQDSENDIQTQYYPKYFPERISFFKFHHFRVSNLLLY